MSDSIPSLSATPSLPVSPAAAATTVFTPPHVKPGDVRPAIYYSMASKRTLRLGQSATGISGTRRFWLAQTVYLWVGGADRKARQAWGTMVTGGQRDVTARRPPCPQDGV
jgi:hypothetical protein